MDSQKLNDWLQVVGLFGVLGGLIFVGLQLRLDRQIALASATEAASQDRQQWAELVNSNPDVWAKGLSGEALSFPESLRFDALAQAFEFRYFTSQYRANQLDNTDPERFALELAVELHRYPGLRRWWDETRDQRIALRQRMGRPDLGWSATVEDQLESLSTEPLKGEN